MCYWYYQEKGGFPGGSDGEESACYGGDPGLIPVSDDLLEKGIATHSSIRAWRIPWTEEPGGLQWNLVGYISWDQKELDTTE